MYGLESIAFIGPCLPYMDSIKIHGILFSLPIINFSLRVKTEKFTFNFEIVSRNFDLFHSTRSVDNIK